MQRKYNNKHIGVTTCTAKASLNQSVTSN